MAIFKNAQETGQNPKRPEDEGSWDIYEWYRERAKAQKERERAAGKTATSLTFSSMDAGQEHKQRPASTPGEETEVEEVPTSTKKGEELKAELDDLLNEIDEVLEENAEEFVKSYVQKGGE